MSKIKIIKIPGKFKEKPKNHGFQNPYFHHIHVRFGDQVFSFSHSTDFIEAEELYAAMNDIRDNCYD